MSAKGQDEKEQNEHKTRCCTYHRYTASSLVPEQSLRFALELNFRLLERLLRPPTRSSTNNPKLRGATTCRLMERTPFGKSAISCFATFTQSNESFARNQHPQAKCLQRVSASLRNVCEDLIFNRRANDHEISSAT